MCEAMKVKIICLQHSVMVKVVAGDILTLLVCVHWCSIYSEVCMHILKGESDLMPGFYPVEITDWWVKMCA